MTFSASETVKSSYQDGVDEMQVRHPGAEDRQFTTRNGRQRGHCASRL